MKNIHWMIVLIVATFLLMGFNSYQMSLIQDGPTVVASSTGGAILGDLIPTGVPEVWGEEVGFSYDDIDPYDQNKANAAIRKLSVFDQLIEPTGSDLQRYVKILYRDHGGMSCEYCCGAKAIIFENGQSACGCAHSFAMRGLVKYLITNHPEMSDADILSDVGKLKVLFFPSIIQGKAQVMESKGIAVGYLSLTTNANRGIEKGAPSGGGGMVGGC